MEVVFAVLAFLLFLQSIVSFFSTMRFARYALTPQTTQNTRNQRKAVVILPCKGLEHDFEENIRALFSQEYRDFEIIFITESDADPASLSRRDAAGFFAQALVGSQQFLRTRVEKST